MTRNTMNVRINNTLPETINSKMSQWMSLHRLMAFLPKIAKYLVRFRQRTEIFDLVECNIEILIGSHAWTGTAFGINSTTAFRSAFLKIHKLA